MEELKTKRKTNFKKIVISVLFILCKISEIQINEDALTIRKEKEGRKERC